MAFKTLEEKLKASGNAERLQLRELTELADKVVTMACGPGRPVRAA